MTSEMLDLFREYRETELDHLARIAELQRAVDTACNALESSAYVGGPTEREAWQTALRALQEVVTQHQGMDAPPTLDRPIPAGDQEASPSRKPRADSESAPAGPSSSESSDDSLACPDCEPPGSGKQTVVDPLDSSESWQEPCIECDGTGVAPSPTKGAQDADD